jgi:hypothetical protein
VGSLTSRNPIGLHGLLRDSFTNDTSSVAQLSVLNLGYARTPYGVRENVLRIKTPWPESASEVYRPSDRRLSAKLVPIFADRWYHVVSVKVPYGRILGYVKLYIYIYIYMYIFVINTE